MLFVGPRQDLVLVNLKSLPPRHILAHEIVAAITARAFLSSGMEVDHINHV